MHALLGHVHNALVYQTTMGPVWVMLLTLVGLPLANEIVQRSKGTRAQSLLQGLFGVALKFPIVGVLIAKFPVLGDLVYMFAPQDKTGLPTPLFAKPQVVAVPVATVVTPAVLVTDIPTDKVAASPSAATSIASKVVVLFILASVALSACAVWGHAFVASEKTCQIAAIPAEKQAALSSAEDALADPVNWESKLIALAEVEGTEQVNCLVMAIRAADTAVKDEDGGTSHAAISQQKVTRIVNANAWLSKHASKKAK